METDIMCVGKTHSELKQRIKEYKRNIGKSCYLFGRTLKYIKEHKLYEEDTPYWREYCEEIIEVPLSTADLWIRISSVYDEKIIEEWGTKKLILLLTCQESQRQSIFKDYPRGNIPHSGLSEVVSSLPQDKEVMKERKELQAKSKDRQMLIDNLEMLETILFKVNQLSEMILTYKDHHEACRGIENKDENLKSQLIRRRQQAIKELNALGGMI